MIKITNRFHLYENLSKKEKEKEKEIKTDRLKDFEILKILGKNNYSFTAKVRYLKNNKIYAMKSINYSNLKRNEPEKLNYFQRQLLFLKELKHENIIEYITHFEESNCLYIVSEYIDGVNLSTLIDMNKLLNNKVKEEKLLNIFLKCLDGLAYLHSIGLIHRDIKPENILIDTQEQIKIINFKYAAFEGFNKIKFQDPDVNEREKYILIKQNQSFESILKKRRFKAPEISENKKYDSKIDVFSMGKIFCLLAYSGRSLPSDEGNYSKELYDIIKKMIDSNPIDRISSLNALNQLKKLYITKYFYYSGIISSMFCLEAFNFLEKQFLDSEPLLLKNTDKNRNKLDNTISNQFIQCLKILRHDNISEEKKKEKQILSLYEFREILRKNGFNNYLRKNKEIEPAYVLCFLLEKINKELNHNNSVNEDINKGFYNEDIDKEEAYSKYKNWYYKLFSSIITENFFGTIKTKTSCNICHRSLYSFNFFYLIPFNIQLLIEKKSDIKDICDAFDCQNKNIIKLEKKEKIDCKQCKDFEEHSQVKQFYDLPKILIIFFDRGQNCKYKNFINFEQNLNIIQSKGEKNETEYKYDLTCVICRIEEYDENSKNKKREKYIPFIKGDDDYYKNYLDKKDQTKYDLNQIKNKGDVINLFYLDKNKPNYPINPNQNPQFNQTKTNNPLLKNFEIMYRNSEIEKKNIMNNLNNQGNNIIMNNDQGNNNTTNNNKGNMINNNLGNMLNNNKGNMMNMNPENIMNISQGNMMMMMNNNQLNMMNIDQGNMMNINQGNMMNINQGNIMNINQGNMMMNNNQLNMMNIDQGNINMTDNNQGHIMNININLMNDNPENMMNNNQLNMMMMNNNQLNMMNNNQL